MTILDESFMGSETEYGLSFSRGERFNAGQQTNILHRILATAPPYYFTPSFKVLAGRSEKDFQINPAYINEIISDNIHSPAVKNWLNHYYEHSSLNRNDPEEIIASEAGKFTLNGGRIYIDVAHFESCVPGCSNAHDLVVYEKSLEQISARLAKNYSHNVSLIKNNTDVKGNSWGYHLNILASEELFKNLVVNPIRNNQIADIWLLFLVSFPIVCGAGILSHNGYQISQRADFMKIVRGGDTLCLRALIDTRSEFGRAYSRKFKRLHIICFDSNMSEVSTFLKAGVSNLVIKMLENKFFPSYLTDIKITEPVKSFQEVSRDLTVKKKTIKTLGGMYSALDIQKLFLIAAKEFSNSFGADKVTEKIISTWERVLGHFENKPEELSVILDWKIKERLLEEKRKKWGVNWNDPKLKLVDIQYHYTNKGRSLYYCLEKNFERIITDEEIQKAEFEAPIDTRSYFIGFCVKYLKSWIRDIVWHYVDFQDFGKLYLEPFDFTKKYVENKGFPFLSLSSFEKPKAPMITSINCYYDDD